MMSGVATTSENRLSPDAEAMASEEASSPPALPLPFLPSPSWSSHGSNQAQSYLCPNPFPIAFLNPICATANSDDHTAGICFQKEAGGRLVRSGGIRLQAEGGLWVGTPTWGKERSRRNRYAEFLTRPKSRLAVEKEEIHFLTLTTSKYWLTLNSYSVDLELLSLHRTLSTLPISFSWRIPITIPTDLSQLTIPNFLYATSATKSNLRIRKHSFLRQEIFFSLWIWKTVSWVQDNSFPGVSQTKPVNWTGNEFELMSSPWKI